MGVNAELRRFARTVAGLGLVAAISIGLAGTAGAAPADRADDPVVLKGSELGGLLGTAPGKIVAFKWAGEWVQVPVQVDERHTINVRQLYPDQGNGYVGDTTLGFDLEVYADANTRSGADSDPAFDADDELTFMGGDSGGNAPADVSPPAGVDGRSGVKVNVDDPVAGGNAALYLFEATGNRSPGAGKDYVDYDFNLTNLTEGQTLRDDYRYFAEFNPEDSTVKTENYELHSFDRWMEDEMKITMGDSSGVDILDREVAQATLTGCGRSEYTFSGRWQEDTAPGNDGNTDNEGTYVAVIDGPVRAIRSYMGANSGPYVQREHLYYRGHEVNTIFLRVHPMLDLYSWTDYAPSAIGMTYRDMNNTSGVPVDGNPDALVPTTTEDVANGAYAWQQLSGPQGTVSTVVGSETDIPEPNFGNYYLDDSTPVAPNERQCGGDGQSIGASGFGILGPFTPNTDPRLGSFNNLTVDRVRYFGPPSDGADEAAGYRDRVQNPFATSAASHPVTGGPKVTKRARLKVKVAGRKGVARKGSAYRVRVRVKNYGNLAARWVKVCVRSPKLKRRGNCRSIKLLPARKARTVTVKVRVKPNARGRKLGLRVTATSKKSRAKAAKRIKVGLRR